MAAFAVYLVRVRVYEDVPEGKEFAAAVTLLQSTYVNKRRVVEVLVDVTLIGVSYYWATLLVFRDPEAYLRNAEIFYSSLPMLMASQLMAFFAMGLYRGLWRAFVAADAGKVVAGVAIGSAVMQLLLFVYYSVAPVSWTVILLQALMVTVLVIASRLISRQFPPA